LKKLDISFNKLTDENAELISSCVHNIEELDISGCQLTTCGLEKICSGIRQRNFRV